MHHAQPAFPKVKTNIQKTGEPIWSNLYNVTVRYRDTITHNDVRNFGMPTVGDYGMDQSIYDQPQHVCITINAMVDHYKTGTTITFRSNQDARTVYEIVNRYLIAWQESMDGALNADRAPIDDLLLLDRFATSLYPQAIMFGPPPTKVSNSFMDLLAGTRGTVTRGSLTDALQGKNATAAPMTDARRKELQKESEHNSLSGFFANAMSNGREIWK